MANSADYEYLSCLIENVRANKCLYDKKDQFYFNKIKKEKAWEEIGKLCNKSINEVKQKWKLLREKFVKETRKLDSPSGSGFCYNEKWQFFDDLAFLKDSIAVRRTLCNENNDFEIIDVSTEEPIDGMLKNSACSTPVPAKRPRTAIDKLCNKFSEVVDKVEQTLLVAPEPSSDELFIRAMLSLIADLPPSTKDKFQSDMMSEVFKLRAQFRGN